VYEKPTSRQVNQELVNTAASGEIYPAATSKCQQRALYVLLAALRSTLRDFHRVTGCHGRDRDQFPDGLTTSGES